jgi:branched-chain amino acid transport system permease protein
MFALTRLGSVAAVVALCFGIEATARGIFDSYGQRLVVLAALYVILAVSLNLINGITGQFSIGHAAFYQVGAYAAGFVSVRYFAGQPLDAFAWFLVMIVVGAVAASLAGLLVGLPSLRLRGDYLAIVTLGFGEIIRIVVQNIQAVGGSYGMNVQPKIQPIWLVWLMAAICIAVCRNLLKTHHGLAFLAVREDEVASAAMGVNVTRIKVTAFVIGSAFAGAAGAMLALTEGFISPTTFAMDVSFIILTMVVLGGTGSITGSALAAITLFAIPEYLRSLKGADGGPLQVTGAWLAAAVIATIFFVWGLKRIADHYHGPHSRRAGLILGTAVGAIVLQLGLTPLLGVLPNLQGTAYKVELLRMVIFAATLIILMLLRPQGIFGHHELSWDWLRKVVGGRRRAEAS